MKESVGYSVTLNIVITFIIIIFAFLSAVLIYFKSNKSSNVITETIEKYEGYNGLAKTEINKKLTSIGYNRKRINCVDKLERDLCSIVTDTEGKGKNGYCVYLCTDPDDSNYYFYKIRTNMMLNIPIINNLLDIPIFSNTNRLYDFGG